VVPQALAARARFLVLDEVREPNWQTGGSNGLEGRLDAPLLRSGSE